MKIRAVCASCIIIYGDSCCSRMTSAEWTGAKDGTEEVTFLRGMNERRGFRGDLESVLVLRGVFWCCGWAWDAFFCLVSFRLPR